MIKLKSPLEGATYYYDNTPVGKFILYKILYPIVNSIGLNRPFNLLRHKLGYYAELSNGRCQWCGKQHIR
jgi:hypothetical protein